MIDRDGVAELPDDLAEVRAAALADRLKERIYAELTVVAVVLGLVVSGTESVGGSAVSVLGTVLGLWLATIAADYQAHVAAHRQRPTVRELRRALYVSSGLLAAAVGPLLLIGAAALELLDLRAALLTAIGIDLAILFVLGLGNARRMGIGLFGALTAGVINIVIGGVVVAVKLLAGH